MATKHSRLGASSSHRWIECPGSIPLIESLPENERNKTSIYAAEGHAAHCVAANCLRQGVGADHYAGQWANEHIICATEQTAADFFEITDEMVENVQVYLDRIAVHRREMPKGSIELIERTFDMTAIHPDFGGTLDFGIYEPFGEVRIVDLKYGRGVVVDVERNSQLMYYGVGAGHVIGGLRAFDTFTAEVVQPRAWKDGRPWRNWSCLAEDLDRWVHEVLVPAANRVRSPNPPLVAGEWCKFCNAAAVCPARRNIAVQAAQVEFDAVPLDQPLDPKKMMPALPGNDETLVRALHMIPLLEDWCAAVRQLGYVRLEGGLSPVLAQHYKMVRGRAGNRAWKSVEGVARDLADYGDKIYSEPKLLSPAQMEKMLGPNGKEWVAANCFKPEGKISMVPISDERPAVPIALAEFTAVEPMADPNPTSFLDS